MTYLVKVVALLISIEVLLVAGTMLQVAGRQHSAGLAQTVERRGVATSPEAGGSTPSSRSNSSCDCAQICAAHKSCVVAKCNRGARP
jgi:hypothetical protein